MSMLPRIMIVVWRWGNSKIYKLPDDRKKVVWTIANPENIVSVDSYVNDHFIQMDLKAQGATDPLAECVIDSLSHGNVMLFLHDNQDHGYSTEFRKSFYETIAKHPAPRKGSLYIRLFTGGQEAIYCNHNFPKGILGTDGVFASEVRGSEEDVQVVLKFDPEHGKRILNAEHFNFVWEHYWNNTRFKDKLFHLKEHYSRWARRYDVELHGKDKAGDYSLYLDENPWLIRALASFTEEEYTLKRMARNGIKLEDSNDFSEFGDYMSQNFPYGEGELIPTTLKNYIQLKERLKDTIFNSGVREAQQFTLDTFNALDRLYAELPGTNH